MAPAKTGNDNNNKIAVIKTAQTNKESCEYEIKFLILTIVTIKLIAPKIEPAPDKCKLKIAKSTPGPDSKKDDDINNQREGGKSQKLKLLSLGKAISGAPIKRGTNQFPKPPIRTGITIKKIIIKACAVTITL